MTTIEDKGWICLHRSILKWEWWQDVNVRLLFIYCLLSANHTDNKWQGYTIPRGSFITTRKKLSAEIGISETQIRVAMQKLLKTGEILTNQLTNQITNRFTMISVCNYDNYQNIKLYNNQPNDQPNSQPITNRYPTDNQPITHNNNNNNDNNETIKQDIEKNIIKKENFKKPTPEEVQAYCNERGNNISGTAFCDFYEARGWMIGKNRMKDWKAAVRTWENRNGVKHNNEPRLGVGEYITADGRRTYGDGRCTIPMDAPRRMTSEDVWDSENKRWIIL